MMKDKAEKLTRWLIVSVLLAAPVVVAGIGGPVLTRTPDGVAFTQQLGKSPGPGKALMISTGTDTAVASWTEPPPSEPPLPPGAPGQFLCATGTGTATTTAKSWCASPVKFYDVCPSQVKDFCDVGTSTEVARADHIHKDSGYVLPYSDSSTMRPMYENMASPNSSINIGIATSSKVVTLSVNPTVLLSDSTPGAVGTSGSPGTSTSAARADHVHQDSGTVRAFNDSSYPLRSLYENMYSSNGSIVVGVNDAQKKVNLTANFGSAANTVCQGNDPRLSDARTPTAHASTHKGDGSDPVALASQSVAGLMSAADKTKLDNATSTPTANRIPISNASGKLTSWIDMASGSVSGLMSASHYTLLNNATATPTANRIPISDANGTLNGWLSPPYYSACATTDSVSGVLPGTQIVQVSTPPMPSWANAVQVVYHFSGYASTSGYDSTTIYRAEWKCGSGTYYYTLLGTKGVFTVHYGFAHQVDGTTFKSIDSTCYQYTNYYRVIMYNTGAGAFTVPAASQSSYYDACIIVVPQRFTF